MMTGQKLSIMQVAVRRFRQYDFWWYFRHSRRVPEALRFFLGAPRY
jgi:hypothetical protein